MPYNYILDELIVEKSMKIISNSIVIFDEGHNVPDSAC
jgi:Rad3-related DNA helicase